MAVDCVGRALTHICMSAGKTRLNILINVIRQNHQLMISMYVCTHTYVCTLTYVCTYIFIVRTYVRI